MSLLAILLAAALAPDLPALPAGACFEAGFTQTRTLPSLSRPLLMHGQVRLEDAEHFTWRIEKPYRYGFRIDGRHILETLPDGTTRKLDVAEAPWIAGMQKVFAALLDGDTQRISEWFTTRESETLDDGATRLVLQPVSELVAANVRELELVYREHLQSVTLREGGGGRIAIDFDALVPCTGNP